ncbi:MAG: hypothetical protein ACQSGP_16490 [Frankia sp.]
MKPAALASLLSRVVADAAAEIDGPTYLYDLRHLDGHAGAIRSAVLFLS